MQYWTISNKFITSRFFTGWICGLLMIMVTPAMTANVVVDSEDPQYPWLRVSGQSNPWALPQTQQNNFDFRSGFQQQPYDYYQQYQSAPIETQHPDAQYPDTQSRYRHNMPLQNRDKMRQYQPTHQWQPQAERFVTPEFLESLKQQQKQHQLIPENQQDHQPVQRQFMQKQPGSGLPGQGIYSYPSYHAGSANPLYDVPAVSPWGNGADVLYRGESFPMVPSEAPGGISPMHVPSFGMNNYKNSESGEPIGTDKYNVFNPFTFLPDGGY